jgi:hypothetical protein
MREQEDRAADRIWRGLPAGTRDAMERGLTIWTAQLTGNAKERCLVSCLATERLTSLTAPASRP